MLEQLEEILRKVGTSANVKAAFGEPYHVDGKTLIPVARVRMGLGLGGGRGRARPEPGSPTAPEGAEGEGGGGGGAMNVKPIALIEVAGEQVRVLPIVDVGRIVLGGMLLAGWVIFWATRTAKAVGVKAVEHRAKDRDDD